MYGKGYTGATNITKFFQWLKVKFLFGCDVPGFYWWFRLIIDYYKLKDSDLLWLLQPTSPFREDHDAKAILDICRAPAKPWWSILGNVNENMTCVRMCRLLK